MRETIAEVGLCLAVLFLGGGQVITFAPGAESSYYGMAGVIASAGLLSVRLRWIAVGVVCACVAMAMVGYLRGRYRETSQMKYPQSGKQLVAVTQAHGAI